MTSFRRRRLGEILSAKGIVTQEQVAGVLSKNAGSRMRIGELLAAEGLVTEEALAQALAEQRDLRYADLKDFSINANFFKTIPVAMMQRYQFVPLEDAGELLVVAMTDPSNIPAIDELEMVLGRQLEIRVSTPSSIQAVLKRSGSSEQALHAVSEDFMFQIVKDKEDGQGLETLRRQDQAARTTLMAPQVVQLLDRYAQADETGRKLLEPLIGKLTERL